MSAPPPLPRRAAPTARKSIKVTFVKPDGSRQEVSAPIGDSMLEVAHANKIDIEGACALNGGRARDPQFLRGRCGSSWCEGGVVLRYPLYRAASTPRLHPH